MDFNFTWLLLAPFADTVACNHDFVEYLYNYDRFVNKEMGGMLKPNKVKKLKKSFV